LAQKLQSTELEPNFIVAGPQEMKMTKLLKVVGQRVTQVYLPGRQGQMGRESARVSLEESHVLAWPICWDFLSDGGAEDDELTPADEESADEFLIAA
jgi:hypothetical protein